MIEKFIDTLMAIGTLVSEKYIGLQKRWLQLMLWPVYVVFTLLYTLAMLLGSIAYIAESKFKYDIALKESFNAFKEGIMEGIDELKG